MGMEDMNMNINTSMNDGATAFYEVNMGEYGVGVGSMMALMTEQEHPASGENSMMSTITVTMPPPSSTFLTYGHGHVEGLFPAAAVFHGGGNPTTGHRHHHEKHLVGGHFQTEQLAMHEQAAAVISESSLSSVKTEGYSNHLEFHRKAGTGGRGGRSCFPEPSIILRSQSQSQSQSRQSRSQQEHQHQQLEGSRMVNSLDVESECSNNPNDSIDALKTKIAGHPHYHRLLAAYMDCQKIGAPAEVGAVLDKISQENQHGRHSPTINVGADPELDQFMEAYCEMLGKFHVEISKPFKEAMAFMNKIETQLSCLSIGAIRTCPPGEGYLEDREEGGGSSEEDFSCGEIDMHEVDPRAEDKELKDQLLRKYSGYFSSLKQEFLKKKKKGKLPKEARQKLLDWWNLHYKWPYPSETDKVTLAESTGLDQKQINNWFINQRKRHWKPSEEMQFVVMDNPHSASFYIDGAEG